MSVGETTATVVAAAAPLAPRSSLLLRAGDGIVETPLKGVLLAIVLIIIRIGLLLLASSSPLLASAPGYGRTAKTVRGSAAAGAALPQHAPSSPLANSSGIPM